MPTITLPAPRIVFPVKFPYLVRSDMYKLGTTVNGYAEHDFFAVDSDYEKTIFACLDVLKTHPDHGRVYLDDDLDALTACLWEVAQTIADDQPEFFAYTDGQFTAKLLGLTFKRGEGVTFERELAMFPDLAEACYGHLQSVSGFDQICDMLRLNVQEDLVIGKIDPENNTDVMECMLVPLPSKWTPLEKIGLSFAGRHEVIPNSERLVSAAPRLVDAIMTKGPFVRYNWTLASDRLAQDPTIMPNFKQTYDTLNDITDYDEMMAMYHFRVERQTLKAFPNLNRYLFVIHTYSYPFAEVLTREDRKQRLLDVLESIPDPVRKHRSMAGSVITILRQHMG